MDIEDIKRGLRAEIKKRESEQYATFQCNVRQMCKDVLAKLEEQESVIAEKDAKILALDAEVAKQKHLAELFFDERNYAETQLRHVNYKRCLAMAEWCNANCMHTVLLIGHKIEPHWEWRIKTNYWYKWRKIWFELYKKFKDSK